MRIGVIEETLRSEIGEDQYKNQHRNVSETMKESSHQGGPENVEHWVIIKVRQPVPVGVAWWQRERGG